MDTIGYCIPPLDAPDLAVANLIGQVIENREITTAEPDRASESDVPQMQVNVTEIPITPSSAQAPAPQQPQAHLQLGYSDTSGHNNGTIRNYAEFRGESNRSYHNFQ